MSVDVRCLVKAWEDCTVYKKDAQLGVGDVERSDNKWRMDARSLSHQKSQKGRMMRREPEKITLEKITTKYLFQVARDDVKHDKAEIE